MVIAESTRKLLGNLFELEDLGAKDLKGIAGPVQSLGGAATGFSRKPLRGFSRERPDRACRAGRRTRTAAAALVEGKERRRPSGVAFRRGRIGKSRLTAALLERLATEPHTRLRNFCSPQHTDSALVSDHRPDGARRWIYARRHSASETRQARCAARAKLDVGSRCGTLCRDAVAAERRTLSGARTNTATAQAKNTRSARFTSCGLIAPKSRC